MSFQASSANWLLVEIYVFLINDYIYKQAWGPQTYKIWWVSMTTAVDYIKTQYMTSSWACENNKKKNQHILFTAVDYLSGEKFVGEKWRNFYFLTKHLTDEIF